MRNCFTVETKIVALLAAGNARSLFVVGSYDRVGCRTDSPCIQEHLPKSCEGNYAARVTLEEPLISLMQKQQEITSLAFVM
jgi:hypothetical protein